MYVPSVMDERLLFTLLHFSLFYRKISITEGGPPAANKYVFSSNLIWWCACACMHGMATHMMACAVQCRISCKQLSSSTQHMRHSAARTQFISEFSQQVFLTLYFSWTRCLVAMTDKCGHKMDSPAKQHAPQSDWQGQQQAMIPQ